jgi:hypothetical protein
MKFNGEKATAANEKGRLQLAEEKKGYIIL